MNRPGRLPGRLFGLLVASLAGLLVLTVVALPETPEGFIAPLRGSLSEAGVANPVTAVLLNFRAYDTLLEKAVLLLALIGVWALRGHPTHELEMPAQSMIDTLVRLIVPVMVIVAGYLLWVGAEAPGGAFQSAAVLAAAGVLLVLGGFRVSGKIPLGAWRLLAVLGPVVFVAVGSGAAAATGLFLAYPPALAGVLILVIETAAVISIAAILVVLFLGGRPGTGR